jgi:hypothetical protein
MSRIIGLDCGTGNIVCTEKDTEKYIHRKIKDVFFKVNPDSFIGGSEGGFGEAMLKKSGAKYLKIDGNIFILGDDAFKFATMFHQECLRPMARGVLNPLEAESMVMVKELIRGVAGVAATESDVVYYSIPADPIDADYNIVFHSSAIKKILEDLGYRKIYKMNEGLAVVYSEMEAEQYTGIGISFGSGMVNVAYSFLGMPIFSFSLAKSGDFIDTNAAKAVNETANIVQHVKEAGIDLNAPKNKIENAIAIYYDSLINYTVDQFKNLYTSTDPRKLPVILDPLKIVVAGGTSMPMGFIDKFSKAIKVGFPVPISKVELANDPLYAVGRGLYNAAKVKSEN